MFSADGAYKAAGFSVGYGGFATGNYIHTLFVIKLQWLFCKLAMF